MSTSVTSTTHATTNPAITSAKVIMFREANLGFSATVSQRYGDDAKVGTTIRWANWSAPNSGVARTKSEGNSGNDITYDVNTDTAVTLTINQWMYSAYELEEFEEALSIVELEANLNSSAAYVLNVSIDDTLAALVDDFTQAEGTLAMPFGDSEIRRCIQYLEDANAPAEGRYMGVSPAAKMTLLGIERYVSSDFNRGGAGNILTGGFGSIYDLSLFVSTNIEGSNAAGHDNGIWQRDAMAMAMRMKPRTRNFDDIQNLSQQHSISAIWGVIEPRDDHGTFLRGE